MKNIIFLFFILYVVIANAKYEKGTLIFKDSTTQTGLIKVGMADIIKYKTNKDSRPITYSYKELIGVNFGPEIKL